MLNQQQLDEQSEIRKRYRVEPATTRRTIRNQKTLPCWTSNNKTNNQKTEKVTVLNQQQQVEQSENDTKLPPAVADGALVRPFPGVYTQVVSQTARSSEAGLAVGTLVGFLPCVRAQVRRQRALLTIPATHLHFYTSFVSANSPKKNIPGLMHPIGYLWKECHSLLLSISFSCWIYSEVKCWLMSSDVSWHIGDKLWPMPKHGSINLYVHGNQKAR